MCGCAQNTESSRISDCHINMPPLVHTEKISDEGETD